MSSVKVCVCPRTLADKVLSVSLFVQEGTPEKQACCNKARQAGRSSTFQLVACLQSELTAAGHRWPDTAHITAYTTCHTNGARLCPIYSLSIDV